MHVCMDMSMEMYTHTYIYIYIHSVFMYVVSVYVYAYVCMHVCTYVLMVFARDSDLVELECALRLYRWLICMWAHTYLRTLHTYLHAYIFPSVHPCVPSMHKPAHMIATRCYKNSCTSESIHLCLMYVYIYICIYTLMCVCICVSIYI